MAYEISNIHIEMKVTSDHMIKKNYFLCFKFKSKHNYYLNFNIYENLFQINLPEPFKAEDINTDVVEGSPNGLSDAKVIISHKFHCMFTITNFMIHL